MLPSRIAADGAQAWKQDRMDLAEVMFAKADVKHCALELAAAENFADLLFEIGKERLHRKDGHVAIKWFERAYDTLTAQESDRLSQDAVELRLSIMHHLGSLKSWDSVSPLANITFSARLTCFADSWRSR